MELTKEAEIILRQFLWRYHGHTSLYGDDGEMQCCQCSIWNYKIANINELILQASRELRKINLNKYLEDRKKC